MVRKALSITQLAAIESGCCDSNQLDCSNFEPIDVDFQALDFRVERARRQA